MNRFIRRDTHFQPGLEEYRVHVACSEGLREPQTCHLSKMSATAIIRSNRCRRILKDSCTAYSPHHSTAQRSQHWIYWLKKRDPNVAYCMCGTNLMFLPTLRSLPLDILYYTTTTLPYGDRSQPCLRMRISLLTLNFVL